MNKKLL